MRAVGLLLAILVISLMTTQAWEATDDLVHLQVLDPAINTLVPAGSRLQRVASGFKWTEGPVWMRGGSLLFAEIPSNSIRKWTAQGGTEIVRQPSGYAGEKPFTGPEPGSNGMTLDSQGRLTVAGHAGRTVWRLESSDMKSRPTVLADRFEGKKLNSPNDLVYRNDGSLYFTDPPYGLPTQSDEDPGKELKWNGVYRIDRATEQKAGSAPDPHRLTLLIRDLSRPNGLVFSPDEKTLYVCNSDVKRKIWMRYRVDADGGVSEPHLIFDATSDERKGSPDGMKVDGQGNLYSTGPGGIWIFSPEGKQLGVIQIPEPAANLAWGDADGKTLYITATSSLYRLKLSVGGVRPGVH